MISTASGYYVYRVTLRDSLHDWLMEERWTHFVTLAFNDSRRLGDALDRKRLCRTDKMRPAYDSECAPSSALVSLKRWDQRVNRAIVGPKWLKRPDERLRAVFVPESLDRNPHFHAYIRVQPDQMEKFENRAAPIWEKVYPKGSADIQSFDIDLAKRGYLTKYAYKKDNFDSVIFSSEFQY